MVRRLGCCSADIKNKMYKPKRLSVHLKNLFEITPKKIKKKKEEEKLQSVRDLIGEKVSCV